MPVMISSKTPLLEISEISQKWLPRLNRLQSRVIRFCPQAPDSVKQQNTPADHATDEVRQAIPEPRPRSPHRHLRHQHLIPHSPCFLNLHATPSKCPRSLHQQLNHLPRPTQKRRMATPQLPMHDRRPHLPRHTHINPLRHNRQALIFNRPNVPHRHITPSSIRVFPALKQRLQTLRRKPLYTLLRLFLRQIVIEKLPRRGDKVRETSLFVDAPCGRGNVEERVHER